MNTYKSITMASLEAVTKSPEAETTLGWDSLASSSYSRFVSSLDCFLPLINLIVAISQEIAHKKGLLHSLAEQGQG